MTEIAASRAHENRRYQARGVERPRIEAPNLDGRVLPITQDHIGIDRPAERVGIDDERPLPPSVVKRRLFLADLLAIVVGMTLSFAVHTAFVSPNSTQRTTEWMLALGSVPIWFAAAAANDMYVARANVRPRDEFRHVVTTVALGVLFTIAAAFLLQIDGLTRGWVVSLFVFTTAAWSLERWLARRVFLRLRREGRLARRILIVGTGQNASDIAERVQRRPELGYQPVGFVGSVEPRDPHGLRLLGDVDEIEDIAASVGATGVMISLFSIDGAMVNSLSRRLTDSGLHVALGTSLCDIDIPRLRVQELDGHALLYIEPTIRTGWRRIAMRVFDYTIAALGLFLALPIVVVAAIAIKLDSSGPVFFRQLRIGEGGQPFEMLKLRTMVAGAEQLRDTLLDKNESDGPLFKIEADPRITRVGRVLRKYSIDEIPQFWNVISGEMSVVGPRPALPSEVEAWDSDAHERLRVLPGITGMWQISGRAQTTFEEYKRLDMYYVDNWSLAHDVRIVLRTIGAVVRGTGAS